MAKPKILLIDDDETFLELFLSLPEAQEYDILTFTSAKRALTSLQEEETDLIISDVEMPEMTGSELFYQVRDLYPDIPMILITAFGCAEDAIRVVKEGAFHYFEKPLRDHLDLFWTTVREALDKREILKELSILRREKSLHTKDPVTIVGESEGIRKVIRSINEVADIPVNVLISGETGTGKELVAQAIHHQSNRKEMPFLAINCNEFAVSVLESELFGHERGAFTGAVNKKIGLFDVVHKGSLFLDEISEAPSAFQSKLLRVVEAKTFMRVGGTTPLYSDFRLLAATNRDLEAEITNGRFRQDLYYRLNVYRIDIPPLRDRKGDIPLLAWFYLQKFANMYHRSVNDISMDAMFLLKDYNWPGNVRELINIIERAVITCQSNTITPQHLPFQSPFAHETALGGSSDLNLKDMEKLFIEMALKRTKNRKVKAAELLGINRKTLAEKLRIYKIDV